MRRPLLKYFLSICILLLNGYGQLSARNLKSGAPSGKIQNLKGSDITDAYAADPEVSTKFFSAATKEQTDFLDVLYENEENQANEDFDSLRKQLENNNFPTCTSLIPSFGYFFNESKTLSSFANNGFQLSPCRYIAFQVFRI